jgi:hypothetical protein
VKTKAADTELEMVKAKADIACERRCLKCRTKFWSEGFGERICSRCKGKVAWRIAVPGGGGQGRRRSGGRLS